MLVRDDQRHRFLACQEPLQSVGIATHRLVQALAAGKPIARRMLLSPRPVRANRRSVEGAGVDLVEVRLDEERDCSAVQSEVDRFAGAQEPRAYREIDLDVGDLRAEATRLRPPARREARTVSGIAAHDPPDVRGRLAVPGEDEEPHRQTGIRAGPRGPAVHPRLPPPLRPRAASAERFPAPAAEGCPECK
jgi:hypothetical protein